MPNDTFDSFGTSRDVIEPMWDIARRLGFTGGTVLETSAGIGHFLGLQPADLAEKTKWKAVELDSITGRMLRKLYPQAQVQVTGFESAKMPNHSVDMVIGNFPFAKDGPIDDRYPRLSLHNYFFARSVDVLKPGGIIMAITSNSTMDAGSSRAAREWLAERADLVGAIRLPNTAFKKNAGTEVTTDIVILRKRGGSGFSAGHNWLNTQTIPTYNNKGEVSVNEYFARKPEMMLGRMSLDGSMYRGDEPALLPTPGAVLSEQLKDATSRLPENVIGTKVGPAVAESQGAEGEQAIGKDGLVVVKDGAPYVIQSGVLVKPLWSKTGDKAKLAVSYVGLREHLKKFLAEMRTEGATDNEITTLRQELNRLYDAHIKKFGSLNERSHNFLEDDPELPLVQALEDIRTIVEDSMVKSGKNAGQKRSVFKKVFDKATIFARRTIFPRSEPTTADTLVDGIQQSLAYRNSIDTEYIAKLRNTTVEDIEAQLHAADDVFHDPKTGIFETTDAYLSGFVRVKLANAQRAAQDDARYQKNVTALEKAQPRWLGMDEISFRLGSSWLPTNLISDFIADKLRVTAKVDYVEQTGHWILTPRSSLDSTENKTTFGSIDDKGNGLRATDIVDALLNLKSPVVFDEIETAEGKKRVRNDQQTLIAQQKAQELQRAFREWVQAKDGTHAELEKIYNDRFNGVVLRKFKGPTWEHYPNASQEIKLREHQKNVVWRILQESTLLAHSVGTGKTFIMITAAMEMRRLGLAKKPMIVTQNATTMQFAASFKKLYPTARILVPSEKQRKAENRKRLMSQIATGDYDAIIIPQSFLDQLPDDPERLSAFINQEISELEDARASAAHDAGKNSPRVKDLEKAKKRLEERLKALMDRKVDDTITFEQLGVDALFVDEAHAYKKLEFQTQMENIKGLDRGASERGLGLYMKTRWIQEKNNGKNVVLATGTPVSNTIAEAWNMLRFTRPDLLEAYGVERFDDFASTFGDTVTNIEQTAGGTFKQVTRFAKYTNGPELIALFHSAADVVLKDDVNLPNLPALKNGQPTTIMVKKSPELASYIELLRSYLASFEAMSGREKRDNSHIPLVVFGLAKKATLDLRLIDSSLPDDPGSKLNRVVQEVLRVHRESADAKGTQLVFADLFQNPDGKFNLYEEIRDKLVAAGIPREQVAIISEAKNAAQRERIFEAVKAGEIRVMLGSTEKMGVGVNVQERLIALHHMDAPARPMDIEQRNGRIIRQGNTNPVVEVFNYGVENTLDATLYQRLAIKQKFINQIMRGDIEGRSFEDAADEVSMTFEEQMAAFSGNPLAMKKVAVEGELRRLEALKSGHDRQQISVREDIGRTRIKLEDRNRFLPKLEQSVKEMIPTIEAEATGVIGGTSYDNRKALIEALDKLIAERKGAAEKVVGAEGFKSDNIEAPGGTFAVFGQQVEAVLRGNLVHFDTVDDDGKPKLEERWEFGFSYRSILPTGVMVEGRFTTGQGFLTSFASQIQNLKYRLEALKSEVAGMQRNLTEAEGFVGQPFAQAADLERLRNEAAEIEKELQAGGADTSGATPPREVHGVKPGDTFTFAPEVTAADETLAGDWMLIGIGMKKNGEQLAPVVKVRSVATNRIIDQLPEKEMRSASIVKRGLLSAPKSQTAPDDGVSASRASAAPEIGADPLQGFRMKPSKVNPERNVVGTLHGARWWSDGRAIYKGERPEKFEVTRPQAEASTGLAHYIPTPKATERQLRILGLERTANSDRLWMSNGMSVDPTYFLIARTIDPAVQPFASPGKLEAITFANPDTKEIVGIAMMNSLNIPTPDFVKSQMDGQTLGTPPESAGEDTTAPTLDPGKNAKVPGQDGYRYRSFPDSMILAGIETARQIYKTRGNKADDATAKDIINEIGEARAAEIAMDRASDLPGALKSAITVNLLHTLNKRRFDNTLTAAQRRAAQVMADRIAQVRAEQFTDMGQEIQFLSRLGDYDEDGVLQAARRGARQRQEKMVGDGGVQATKEITQEMKDANEKAIDEATADLEAALRKIRVGKPIWKRYQEMAARRWMKRIDAALNGAPEMPPMMEFTQRLIREVQNKIDAVLPQQDRPAPKTPAEIIREAVENRSKYAEAWDAAREAIGEQYADQPDVLEKLDDALAGLLDQPFSDKTIDRAIREAHQQMGITVRDLARMHYKQVDALGRTLAQKLVEDAGLRQEDAELVAKRVQERMADVTRDAKKRALARLAAGRTGVAKRMLSSADRIIEFSNLGAFSEAEYFDMLADILKLPKLTEEKAEKLRLLAARAQEAPEGFQRDRVMTDILTELQKIRGIGTVDIATAIYYMHILSGYTTQAVNGVSTALNTAADVTVLVARNPSTAGEAIRGLRDGAKNGFQQALAIISTGYAHRHFDEKLPEVAPVIEALSKDADRNAALRNYSKLLRYIGRGMKAVDAVFFYSASEAFQRVAAAKLAAEFEGGRLSWQERAAKVRELLSMSPADFEQARQKAKAEGLTGIDYQLRVGEILRQKRDPSLTQGGTDFGREATFNNEPRGYLINRKRTLVDDNNTRIEADRVSWQAYENDVAWRKGDPAAIFKLSNLHLPLTATVVEYFLARAEEACVDQAPYFDFEPIGPSDVQRAKNYNQYYNWKLDTKGKTFTTLQDAMLSMFVQRATILKATFVDQKSVWNEKNKRVLYDRETGQPIEVLNHGVIIEDEDIWDEFAGEGGTEQRLRADPTIVFNEARHEWREVTLRREEVLYRGPKSHEVEYDAFLCPNNASSVDAADVVCEVYDRELDWFARLWLDRPWAKWSDVQSLFTTGDASAKTDGQAKLDTKENLSFDTKNPKRKALEFWVRRDVLGWGTPQEFVIFIDEDTQRAVYYEFQAKVCPDMKRPYTVIAVGKTRNRWWGKSLPEKISQYQLEADKQFNSEGYRNKIRANPFKGGDRSQMKDPDANLDSDPEKYLDLKPGAKLEDVLQFATIPDLDERTQFLVDYIIKQVQLWLGVSNIAQGDYSNLPDNNTKYGIEATLVESSKISKRWIRRILRSLEEHVLKLVQVAMATIPQNAVEVFQFTEGKQTIETSLTADEIRSVEVNVKLRMRKRDASDNIERARAALDVQARYMATPVPYQPFVRPLLADILAELGYKNVDELLPPIPVMPGVPLMAPPADPNGAIVETAGAAQPAGGKQTADTAE